MLSLCHSRPLGADLLCTRWEAIPLEVNCLVRRNPARTTGEHHWFLLPPPSYMNTINVWGLEAKGTIRSWRKFSLALHPFQPHPAQWAWHSPPLQGPHLDTIYSKLLHECSCPQSTTTSGEIAAVCNVSNPMTLLNRAQEPTLRSHALQDWVFTGKESEAINQIT